MGYGKPWTPEQQREVFERVSRGEPPHVISREMGRTVDSVQSIIWKNGWTQRNAMAGALVAPNGVTLTRAVRSDPVVTVLAPLETGMEPEESFLARVLTETEREVNHKKTERYVTVRIASDKPIAFSISSDWHLSAKSATDVKGLLAYADAIGKTPGAYAVAVGDMIDNPIKHKPQNVTGIPDDLRLLDIALARFNGKLLGMTSGNHDDWTKALVGVDSLKPMAERHRLHYAPDELVWLVEIVDPNQADHVTARWVVATRHQYRRHSNLNTTHACWRWLEDEINNWPNDGKGASLLPDIIAIGHNHCASVEARSTQRGTVIGCRMGSWQYTSSFTRAKGYTLAPPTAPTIILPNVRDGAQQPHAYERYQDALKALA